MLYFVISEYVLKKKRQLFASMDYSHIFVATKVATMKTKPYGVRFNEEDLELLKAEKGILSTQKAVNFWAQFWRENRFVSGSMVEDMVKPVSDISKAQVAMDQIRYRAGKVGDSRSMGDSSLKTEPSAVVSAEVSKPSMDDLRKLMDAPMKGIFDVEKEVVVEEVDYKKLYEGCEFSDEYRALWERIKADDNVSTKDKNEWKLRLGAK